ncbi:P-loop containing nucleoside triphosphate hydrolase protein [Hyaloraphidium curvatum]|nr:P-loop containing nucleoside triphosphate hydrolase protein [Hyaloraphidium curvatum]
MIRNEQEGLRRKRVNEVSKKRRRPLAAIEKTMEQMAQKVRTKQSEVNHVRGRMEAEIAKKRAQGGDGAGPSDAPAEDEPERAPAPSNAADGNACAVCFDTNIEEPCVTPCAHVFCFGCIRPVLDVTKECPLCRTRLTASDLRVAAPEKAEEDEGAPQEVLDVKGEYGSKITRIVADVQQRLARDPTTKFVIFSHWTKMLRLVATALEANGIGTADFTGPRDGRGDALTRIKEDPGTSVILVGMRSREGAAGLTLTCCNVCYIVEPAISPGLVDQAIGRINRIGQTRPTTVVHLIVKDSIESKIEALQKRKRMAAKRGGQQLAEAASSIAERAGKGKQSAGAVKFAGANQEREELLTEEVCFIFDVDVDELRKDSELQQEAIATVQQRVREMGGGRSRRRRIDWSDDELEIMEE